MLGKTGTASRRILLEARTREVRRLKARATCTSEHTGGRRCTGWTEAHATFGFPGRADIGERGIFGGANERAHGQIHTAGNDPARSDYLAGGGGAGGTGSTRRAGRRGAEAGTGTGSGRGAGATGASYPAAESVCRSRGPAAGHVGRSVGRNRTLCGRPRRQTERHGQMDGAALLWAVRGDQLRAQGAGRQLPRACRDGLRPRRENVSPVVVRRWRKYRRIHRRVEGRQHASV